MSHLDLQLVIITCQTLVLHVTTPSIQLHLPLPRDQEIYSAWLAQSLQVKSEEIEWNITPGQLLFSSPGCKIHLNLSSHDRLKLERCLSEFHQREQLYAPFVDTCLHIYSLENCRYCDLTLELLKENGIEYHLEEVFNKSNPKYGSQLDALRKTYPEVTTFPLVVWQDGKVLGGYTELKKLLTPARLNSEMSFDAEF